MKETGLRLLVKPTTDRHTRLGDRLYWAAPEEVPFLLKEGYCLLKDYDLHKDTNAIMERNKH